MYINEKRKTFDMSETEYESAMTHGTDAYYALREMRNDYPTFRPFVVKTKKPRVGTITKSMIESYVKANGTPEQKKQYLLYTSPYDDKGNYIGVTSFLELKKWFLAEFPSFTSSRKDRDEQIREINKEIEKKISDARDAEAKKRYKEYKDFADEFAA